MSFRLVILIINVVVFLACSIDITSNTNAQQWSLYIASSAFLVMLYISVTECMRNVVLANDLARVQHDKYIANIRYEHLSGYVKRQRAAAERLKQFKR